VIPLSHWSFTEMLGAFGWSLEQYLFHGGYPGAAPLIGKAERWTRYVADSLIETSIARDVLLLTRVDKPALLVGGDGIALQDFLTRPVSHWVST
jgi:hypothetical protein